MSRILQLLLLFAMVEMSRAAECDVAVVVVASVFGTIAVILLIVGILGFILWKKRPGLISSIKPHVTSKNGKKKGDGTLISEDPNSPPRDGYVNLAFNNTADLSALEEGNGGYPGFDSPDGKRPSPGSNRKTWASLPKNDFSPSFNRQGSCGSLDDNYLQSDGGITQRDPEIQSVWLQSQDFIGLGFNVSGNMRDGIFVSHVHNRGPAIESNKVKVGDKILNVTISFEKIVYEDALTILSYASPYPVKVTLQKEKVTVTDKVMTSPNSALSHPLYRSQSLDALNRIGKDSYKPKRTYSEMKPETRKENAIKKQLSGIVTDPLESDSQRSTPVRFGEPGPDGQSVRVSDILVHKAEEAGVVKDGNVNMDLSSVGVNQKELDVRGIAGKVDDFAAGCSGQARERIGEYAGEYSGRVSGEIDGVYDAATGRISNSLDGIPGEIRGVGAYATGKISNDLSDEKRKIGDQANELVDDEKVKISNELSEDTRKMVNLTKDGVDGEKARKSSTALEFANLMDKMLDINQPSEEPFSSMEVKTLRNGPVVEDSFSSSMISETQTSPPTKPTRKKKRSSTASNSSEELSLSQSDIKVDFAPARRPVVEDVMTVQKVVDVSAAPKISYEGCAEIEEDSIQAENKSKDISILSALTEKAKETSQNEDLPSPTLLHKVLLESLDNVKVKKKPEPEGEPVEEEVIEPVKVSRDECAPPLPNDSSRKVVGVGLNNNLKDIDDELMDEIIAMNNRPIEQTGILSRNAREKFGGVSYDIQVSDLEKVENQFRSEMGKEGPRSPTGGQAFEIREDIHGKMVSLEMNKGNVTRTTSEATLQHGSHDDEAIKILRAGSLKDGKHQVENDFDWSGKRLIRSGSFSEIPQDNSVKDWTDQNRNTVEDMSLDVPDNIKGSVLPTDEEIQAKKAVMIKESLDLTSMSDISSSQSPSSTRSSSPYTPNGPPELSPLALKKALDFASSESYSSSSRTGSYSFTLHHEDNDDADC